MYSKFIDLFIELKYLYKWMTPSFSMPLNPSIHDLKLEFPRLMILTIEASLGKTSLPSYLSYLQKHSL